MSIVAACPHCESRFHLQPDLIGKAMRCPNPDCREPFIVQEAPPKSKKSKGDPRPTHTSGKVGEVIPVVEAEPAPRPKRPRSNAPAPDLPPLYEEPEEPQVVEAVVTSPPERQVVEGVVTAPPAAREVVWSPDADIPGGPPLPKSKPVSDEPSFEEVEEPEEEITYVRKRKKKKNYAPLILIGMLIFVVLLGGGVFAYVMKIEKKSEEAESAEAEAEYKKPDYGVASKKYDELAKKGGPNAEKYRFLADLSALRQNAYSVTSYEKPKENIDKIKSFIEANKSQPFLKPTEYGQDIFATGRKILDDVKKNAEERMTAYKADRRNKPDELKKCEDMIEVGHQFIPVIKDFRTKDDKSLDELRDSLDDKIKPAIAYERKRLEVLAELRKMVENPTDPNIQMAKDYAVNNNFADDDEAKEIIRTGEANFLKAVRFEREPGNPQPPPPAQASLLFVAPVGETKPIVHSPDSVPGVFLAVARGVLYALEEEEGKLLWAARVGPDVFDPPAIASVQLPEGPTDLALVTSNVAGRSTLTAYVLRTGQARWSQPLTAKAVAGMNPDQVPAAPAAGPAAVVGNRAYVPVRDPSGSVLIFDITTGMKIGRITIGQTIGPGAIVRPGTAHLYIAAESRRIYLFDVEAVAMGGDAVCLRVIPTDHPTGSLRTVPIIVGQPGDDPSPRFLVLSQSNGEGMKFRAYSLQPTPIPDPNGPPLMEPLPNGTELTVNGWSWFPPVSDSERLSVVTDRNQFRIFGINQPGNNDAALFPLPFPAIPEPPKNKPVRGLVVPAEEGAYWVLVGGSLSKFRLTLLPDRGLTLVPAGAGLAIGEPTQPAQLNPRHDTACFVVASANSSGARAVAVRLQDGEPRWQRQLGIIPSSPPAKIDGGLLLVDGDGGAVTVPSTAGAMANAAAVVAAPIDGVTHPTQVVLSADGKTAFTIATVGEGAVAKFVVRRAVNGKFDHTGSMNAPGALAGVPIVMNGTLLIPTNEGFVHRLVLGDGRGVEDKLVPGPKWMLSRTAENPECFIVALTDETFITSDGNKMLKRWTWPANGSYADDNAAWHLRGRIANTPLALSAAAGKPARLLVADTAGGISLFPLDRGSDTPIRRWTPGVTLALPGGAVSPRFASQIDSAGRQLAAYTVNVKHMVCLDVDSDDPRRVFTMKEDAASSLVGTPLPAGDGRWLVTDLGGRVSILNSESGQAELTREVGLPGAVPATPGIPLAEGRILVPLSDGSAAIVEMKPDTKKE